VDVVAVEKERTGTNRKSMGMKSGETKAVRAATAYMAGDAA
jgi:hypothetical protein